MKYLQAKQRTCQNMKGCDVIGIFSSIWVNRDGIRRLFRFVNTLVQFCGEHACSVSCRFCVLDTGFALVLHSVSLNIRIISSSSSSLVRYVLRL